MEFLKGIPPEWLMIISLVAGILVKYVHGKPILTVILTWLSQRGPLPAPLPTPETPEELPARWVGPLRRLIRDEIKPEVQAPAPGSQ